MQSQSNRPQFGVGMHSSCAAQLQQLCSLSGCSLCCGKLAYADDLKFKALSVFVASHLDNVWRCLLMDVSASRSTPEISVFDVACE